MRNPIRPAASSCTKRISLKVGFRESTECRPSATRDFASELGRRSTDTWTGRREATSIDTGTVSGQSPETVPVSIEVASRRPVQVSVDLRPNSEAKSLVALGLHSVDSRKPTLSDIRFVHDEAAGRIGLRIGVPESQPPGTYSGVIVNRDNGETRGTLSIRIAD